MLGGLEALFNLSKSENEKVKKYAFDALGCLGIVDGDDVGKWARTCCGCRRQF